MIPQHEILEAAKEAGLDLMDDASVPYYMAWHEEIERFAAIIERKTIERAAVACIKAGDFAAQMYGDGAECISTAEECAAAIRKLGEQ